MFRSIFESNVSQERTATVLAALTVSPRDQAAVFTGIMSSAVSSPTLNDWRPNAAAAFIKASSFVSSELVDAVLASKRVSSQVALVDQHQLLTQSDLVRVIDSPQLPILAAAATRGLLSSLPSPRVLFMLQDSVASANMVLSSNVTTVEHLRVAISSAYVLNDSTIPPSVPHIVFKDVVNRFGFVTVSEVVRAAPVSHWWIPLLTQDNFSSQLSRQFFDAVFVQLAEFSAAELPSSAQVSSLIRLMLEMVDVFDAAGKFPALYETSSNHTQPSPRDLLHRFASQSRPVWLRTAQCKQLAQQIDVIVSSVPPPIALPDIPDMSRRVERAAWLVSASVSDIETVWRANMVSFADLAYFANSAYHTSCDALFAMLDALSSEPSFMQVLPDLYRLLLKRSVSRATANLIYAVADSMPFEMQVDTLVMKDLVAVVDPQLLHAWWLTCEGVSFDQVPAVVSSDAPLRVAAAVASFGSLSDAAPPAPTPSSVPATAPASVDRLEV